MSDRDIPDSHRNFPGATLVAAPGQAHHSSAIYESEKTVTLTGEVREFQWTNPHCWIRVIVPGKDGDE